MSNAAAWYVEHVGDGFAAFAAPVFIVIALIGRFLRPRPTPVRIEKEQDR